MVRMDGTLVMMDSVLYVISVRRALSRDAQPEPVPTPSTNQWLPFGGVDDDNEDPQHPWCEHSLTYTHRLMGMYNYHSHPCPPHL
jgi:hypothetical protein